MGDLLGLIPDVGSKWSIKTLLYNKRTIFEVYMLANATIFLKAVDGDGFRVAITYKEWLSNKSIYSPVPV